MREWHVVPRGEEGKSCWVLLGSWKESDHLKYLGTDGWMLAINMELRWKDLDWKHLAQDWTMGRLL
jgi:hypothetical protein